MNNYDNGTASFFPNITELFKEIVNDMTANVVKEGQSIIIVDNYRWFIESLSLMAKQLNLCDSCILLLENGMEQEAYLLVRSQFNNMLWIKYICDDTGEEHVKEYFYQPYISQIKSNKNLKKMLKKFTKDLDERFDKVEMSKELDESTKQYREILKENNITSNRTKSISDLSQQNGLLFGMYVTLYNDASKFEHSDISKTKLYRKQILEEYEDDQVFTFDTGKSDKGEWLTVLRSSLLCLFNAFDSFYQRVDERESHLFLDTAVSKAAYSKEDFNNIMIKFKYCIAMLEKAEQESK